MKNPQDGTPELPWENKNRYVERLPDRPVGPILLIPPSRDWAGRLKRTKHLGHEIQKKGLKLWYKTPEYAQIVQIVLRIDGFTCRRCGNEGTLVHHLSYDNAGDEHFEDVETLCKDCHAEIHTTWRREEFAGDLTQSKLQ